MNALKRPLVVLVAWLAFFWAASVFAHSSSNSFITIQDRSQFIEVRLDIPLRDLGLRFDLDRDQNGSVTWQEIRSHTPEITQWLNAHIQWSAGKSACRLTEPDWAAARYGEEHYLSLIAALRCEPLSSDRAITIRYQLFFDQDALHRGLVKASIGGADLAAVLSPERPEKTFDPSESGFLWTLGNYFTEGVWHIWIGADHILFLLSLLLPCVFLRSQTRLGQWLPIDQPRPAIIKVIAVVTAFTVAHSITLGLAVLGVLNPPQQWVEIIIAASVIVAALGNLTSRLIHLRWQIAFGFGLVHGFGFAGVLSDLGLPREQITAALLGFNLGVEAGQLAIVLGFFPLAWALRATAFYRWGVVVVGSIGIAAIATYWLIQRLGL